MTQPEMNAGTPPVSWWERLGRYALLVRADRPIGILLLLWPAMWALWIAGEGQPDWGVVLIFALGVTLMRSAGCALMTMLTGTSTARWSAQRIGPSQPGW